MNRGPLPVSRRRASSWVSIDDARRAARRSLPRSIFDFVDGGAERELTLTENRAAFADIRLAPRVLVDVSNRDLQTTVMGRTLRFPVICGPTGMPALVHPDAEKAAARAAEAAGVVFTASTTASYPLTEISQAVSGPLWFQLYAWRDRGLTGDLIDQAKAAGCEALLFTVDTPLPGSRERDLRHGLTIPPRLRPANALDMARHIGWVIRFLRGPGIRLGNLESLEAAPKTGALGVAGWFSHLFNPAQSWDDLDWIASRWGRPLAIKGVQHPSDALRARDHGATAVIVSNHGGRQLDGVDASVRLLKGIAEALSDTGVEVLVDGGIRRGSDVVKALALGARAVLIGRPWLYGLAAAGEQGVGKVLTILESEIDRTLALLGCPSVKGLDGEFLGGFE